MFERVRYSFSTSRDVQPSSKTPVLSSECSSSAGTVTNPCFLGPASKVSNLIGLGISGHWDCQKVQK